MRLARETLEHIANAVVPKKRVDVRLQIGPPDMADQLDWDLDRVRHTLEAEDAWPASLGARPRRLGRLLPRRPPTPPE